MHFKLAFIGFGTVGQGLTEILIEKKEILAENSVTTLVLNGKADYSLFEFDGCVDWPW